MSHLVLELRAGETMMVNGATIRFRNKCRLELISQARFLFGKQLMEEGEAATPLEHLYYRLQTAYVGGTGDDTHPADRDLLPAFDAVRHGLSDRDADQLAIIASSVAAADHYRALKLLRAMIVQLRTPAPLPLSSLS